MVWVSLAGSSLFVFSPQAALGVFNYLFFKLLPVAKVFLSGVACS